MGDGDDTVAQKSNTEYLLSITGPASSLSAGMTIASISTDITYISAMWAVEENNRLYRLRFNDGTGSLASDATVIIDRMSTAALLSGEVALDSDTWRVVALGTGPNASTID
jgi:hypothetical protein